MFKLEATGCIDEITAPQQVAFAGGRTTTLRSVTISERWGEKPQTLTVDFWGRDAAQLDEFRQGDFVTIEAAAKSIRRNGQRGPYWVTHLNGYGIRDAEQPSMPAMPEPEDEGQGEEEIPF